MSTRDLELEMRREMRWSNHAYMAEDDESTRLVFADLLLDQGDPRGELIVMWSHFPTDDPKKAAIHYAEYEERERPFNDAAKKKLPPHVKDCWVWCGFVIELAFDWAPGIGERIATLLEDREMRLVCNLKLRRSGEEAPMTSTIVEIGLVDPNKAPHFYLDECALDDSSIEAFAGARDWSGLVELSLEYNRIGPRGIDALARCALPDLRSFSAGNNPLTDEGGLLLARAKWLPQIDTLTIRDCNLGDESTIAILARMERLNALRLDRNPIGDTAARALAKRSLGPLSHLWLDETKLGVSALEMLVNAPHVEGLVDLQVSENPLGDAAIDVLTRARSCSKLERLDVASTGITGRGLETLVSSGVFPKLGGLWLAKNPLGDVGARALANAQWKLTSLNIDACDISVDGLRSLLENPRLASLTWLNVDHNALGNAGGEAIARATHLTSLSHLYVAKNGIRHGGIVAIARAPHLSLLSSLVLRENRIGIEDMRAITEHLRHLRSLEVAQCGLDDEAAFLLARAKLPHLSFLSLWQNSISAEAYRALVTAYPHALISYPELEVDAT